MKKDNLLKIPKIFLFLIVFLILSVSCKKEKEPTEFTNIGDILEIAEKYGQSGEIEKALLFAKRAYAIDPTNLDVRKQLSTVYATLADKYLFKFDCNSAKKYSIKSLEIFSKNNGALNILASCSLAEKKFDDCVSYSKQEIKIDKLLNNESGAPYHNIANCYMHLKKYNQAVENFLEVLKRDAPKENSSYYNNIFSLGRIYFIQGKRQDSKHYLELFKSNYETTDEADLREEYSAIYRETKRMLEMIGSGEKIGFRKGREPAFDDDIVSKLKNQQ